MPTLALALSMLALEQAVTARRKQAASDAVAWRRRADHGGDDASPRASGTVRRTLPTAARG